MSLPIFLKILGICFLVTIVFGCMAFYQTRAGLFGTHYQIHGEAALSVATALAVRLQGTVSQSDRGAMDAEVDQTVQSFPDVRYIVVQDPKGQILSHGFTFPKEAPPDLLEGNRDLCAACHATLSPTEVPTNLLEVPPRTVLPAGRLRAYQRAEGLIMEVTVPIAEGRLGTVRLGVGDKTIVREMASITRSLLWSFALCLALSLSLALVLAYVLVRPIHHLVQATNRLREDDFSARAQVLSDDEIGRLALAFNKMAEGLERYRQEVSDKEAIRDSLMDRIVQAQEDERKRVARELHDQLGQTLSSLLLTVDSCGPDGKGLEAARTALRGQIRGLIDEVRELAWHVRPSILDDYGLDRALARYVEESSKRIGIPIDYQCVSRHDAMRLPERIEGTMYRIAQEAITNISRHAKATQASVVLLEKEREVSLVIEDNGRGFVPAASVSPGAATSLGIVGMRERATLVGGELTIDSGPGRGTTVRARIPLHTEKERAG